ncbi:hypothetical protein DFH08DRAFT_700518 [Mycena albidolilacea]|uniref:Uncharacterized protein n=1 Tax=Mycena albidolilacea TaxID=1033008 RepID=A0AAD7A086_9AGAR|nr:hypothetical protein DFH08DRAFT_700518 [Mycena albidolilacea]
MTPQQDFGADDGGAVRRCKCDLAVVQRTVRKEGPNQGRKFWKCPNMQGTECDTFEWDDEPSRSNTRAPQAGGGSGSFGAGGGSRDQDVCYKCNLPGHWANACPNGEGSAKKARSFGSTSENSRGPSGACYKCNETGHYSADCPSTGGTRARTKSGGGGPALACFKCGEEGHFSNGMSTFFQGVRRSLMDRQLVRRKAAPRPSAHRAVAGRQSAAEGAAHREGRAVGAKNERLGFLAKSAIISRIVI